MVKDHRPATDLHPQPLKGSLASAKGALGGTVVKDHRPATDLHPQPLKGSLASAKGALGGRGERLFPRALTSGLYFRQPVRDRGLAFMVPDHEGHLTVAGRTMLNHDRLTGNHHSGETPVEALES